MRALSYPWRAPGFSLWKSLELVAEVENLTLTDQLTGLPNRRALFQRLDSEDNRLNRYGGKMSIVMIDMTGFKEVNGTYGHLVGDSALQAASHCVRDCLRESVFVARFGGDEFVVLMPETGAEEAAVLQRADDRMYVEKASPGNN
ncbi:MAG TPA: GGDEF domain-containing protein [Synergistales bacterium]|nr:GGDEF domain-containing protein [Synergistales bacterium]